MKIKFNTDYDVPLNKQLYFPTIRCVFEKMVNIIYQSI